MTLKNSQIIYVELIRVNRYFKKQQKCYAMQGKKHENRYRSQ